MFDTLKNSKDGVINKFGRTLIDMCCTLDIHILNGRLFLDTKGEMTCTENNGLSTVDYFIASTAVFDHVTDFGVGHEDFSDHFPLFCTLTFAHRNRLRNTSLKCVYQYK